MRYCPPSSLKELLPTPDAVLPDDVLLYKVDALAEIKQLDGTRQIRFVISTGSVDRDRDVITPLGWQLDNYRRNPVVLWAHNSWDLPIARTVDIGIANDQLYAVGEFASPDLYPFADTVFQLLSAGYLHATSVGFRPQEMTWDNERGGYNFLRCELLEWSVCPVPCNPDCLNDAKTKGIVLAPLKAWAERVLDDLSDTPGLWLPKSQVEQVFAVLSTQTLSVPEPAPSAARVPAPSPARAAAPVSPSTGVAPALQHLARTYAALGQTPPWEAQPAVWEDYLLLTRAEADAAGDEALQATAATQRAALEAQLFPEDADAAWPDLLTLSLADEPASPQDDQIDVDPDELGALIHAAVGQALMHHTGHVPIA